MSNKYKLLSETQEENSLGVLGKIGIMLFLSIFLIVGLLIFYFTALPDINAYKARNWRETPCKVITSKILTKKDQDQEHIHRVEVVYQYEIDGVKYQSDQYNFHGFTLDFEGFEIAQKTVGQYPPEQKTVCYVNPSNFNQAILNRDWSILSIIGSLIIPSPFILVGLLGILFFGYPIIKERGASNVYRIK